MVEACDMGVVGGDDIASRLPWASAHAWGVKLGEDGAKEDSRDK